MWDADQEIEVMERSGEVNAEKIAALKEAWDIAIAATSS